MCNCIRTTIPLGPPAEGRPGPSDDDDDDDDDDDGADDGLENNMLVGDQRGGGNDVEEIGFGTGRPSHDLDGNFSMQT